MFAPFCLHLVQRSLVCPRRCVRTFSSSSACYLRRHRNNSPVANHEKDGDPDDLLSAELPEFSDKNDEFLETLLEEEEEEVTEEREPSAHRNMLFSDWLEKIAQGFRDPQPRNWLGGKVPFPLNPSFKPPPPLSDVLRTQLYQLYMSDPETNTVRTLSSRHNISIKRLDAILRLKGLEEAWKKGRPLQTGFTRGMERLLAVPEPQTVKGLASDELDKPRQYHHTGQKEVGNQDPSRINPRYDLEEADSQSEAEGTNDMARFRYQRMFWENIAEGEEPVMPAILEAARSSSRPVKQNPKVTLVEPRPGRPAIKFIDVGNAFFDEHEQARRDKEGARRALLRARKRGLQWAQPNVA